MISNWIAYFITSGVMFFIGVAFIYVFLAFRIVKSTQMPFLNTISNLLFLAGTAMMFTATAPIPLFVALFLGVSVVFFIVVESIGKLRQFTRIALSCLLISTSGALIFEIPYFMMPQYKVKNDSIYIVGDSLTAGLGEVSIEPYPALINKMKTIEIVDLSIPGSKMKDGLDIARTIEPDNQIVLLELGGNDWRIGSSRYQSEYSDGFRKLMEYLSSRKHRVVMMEIPFPPFEFRLAYAQRQIAKQFDVVMIPKRFLSAILFLTPESTSDGIHLTQKGHEVFAKRLCEIFMAEGNESGSPL
jgi:acyl-CoA thioesterase I